MNKFLCRLIYFSLRNKIVVFFITFLVVVAGTISFLNIPIEAFPDVTNTRVIIITQWPGRSTEEVERFISIPIETEMNVIPRKSSLRSVSLFGLSVVTIIFEDEVSSFDARLEVAHRLVDVDLPDGAERAIQAPSGATGEIYRYTLSSNTKALTDLTTLQDWVIEKQLK